MTILEATKIEGYLSAEPCRDLEEAKKGQVAIMQSRIRSNGERREGLLIIDGVWKNGIITSSGLQFDSPYYLDEDGSYYAQGRGQNKKFFLRAFKDSETVESFLAAKATMKAKA